MDVSKSATIASIGAAPAAPGSSWRTVPRRAGEQDSGGADEASAAGDRVDIGPLSLPGALQILIAEVREALAAELPCLPLPPSSSQAPQGPDPAAQRLVELYLQAVSVDEEGVQAGDWLARLARVDASTDHGFERALQVVSAWHDVTAAVIASLHEVREIMASVLAADEASVGDPGDLGGLATGLRDPFNPVWMLRPEWLRLAPRLDRLRRLRRKIRRSAPDPDARDATLPYA